MVLAAHPPRAEHRVAAHVPERFRSVARRRCEKSSSTNENKSLAEAFKNSRTKSRANAVSGMDRAGPPYHGPLRRCYQAAKISSVTAVASAGRRLARRRASWRASSSTAETDSAIAGPRCESRSSTPRPVNAASWSLFGAGDSVRRGRRSASSFARVSDPAAPADRRSPAAAPAPPQRRRLGTANRPAQPAANGDPTGGDDGVTLDSPRRSPTASVPAINAPACSLGVQVRQVQHVAQLVHDHRQQVKGRRMKGEGRSCGRIGLRTFVLRPSYFLLRTSSRTRRRRRRSGSARGSSGRGRDAD